ncbi:SMI1/KNR4 family protein [Streptomyces beihaiensis]|uniref:SMI1/KNR4 family protein n=1 Tax=Streptomyces beihaiensis TaxID=2984495 RepID=A0ABT3TPX3_9ACTN|nr:SMI1/KNR4 family protein [Streptomyces beihaiensis]MCX3059084.1 SMI1/KNR4 family protein [Streptomyces beihaiensis]
MNNLSELLLRVRDRAEQETEVLTPCVSEQDIADAEQVLGFSLPPLLRLLYLQVANGGFGPDYTLLPLVGDGRTAVAEYGPLRTTHSEYWPRSVLPILDWGCGMYAAVDCLAPDAPVLLFEPNAGPDEWADAWFLDSPSLARWLTSWLDGTGWWEEEVMMPEDGLQPTPWLDAARRLAASV